MIKFFHTILIFLFEKVAQRKRSAFNANRLADSVHTLKKKVRMLGFYRLKPKNKVIYCAARLHKLLFAVRSNFPDFLFSNVVFVSRGFRHLHFFKSKTYAFKIFSFPMLLLLKSKILMKKIRASHTSCEAFLLKSKILTSIVFLGTFFDLNKVGDRLRSLFLLPTLLESNILKVRNLKISGPWFFTSFYFVFMLILPIFSLLNAASKNLFDHFWETATEPVALSAYIVTISMAFFACIFNAFFGFILAWVLVRYNFPGKRLLDAAVDLPFALPTSVAGLTLATVYSDQGWIGSFLSNIGIQIVFTKLGILVAMIFVSFPFVVRTLQPVLQEMEIELEEAAWSLGASPWKTFQKVIFPPLIPAILTGLTLAFSRAIGEYGSIVIVSSNIPLKDLIASVLIFQNLEQYDYTRATVIGTVVLLLSLFLLLGINFLQSWNQKYLKF